MYEVEKRAILSDSDYERLKEALRKTYGKPSVTRQVTYYFDAVVDTRLQVSTSGGKIWQKFGAMHDDSRKELEVSLTQTQACDLLNIFENAKFPFKAVWYRERYTFPEANNGLNIVLDDTVGYAKILEAEVMIESENNIHEARSAIISLFTSLGVAEASKEKLGSMYASYLMNHRRILNEMNMHPDWVYKI